MWDYKTKVGGCSEEELNDLGGEGWELVTITKASDGQDVLLFKQRVTEMMEYTVATSDTLNGLMGKVRTLISDGWRPQGGIAIEAWCEGYPFMQTLVRD